MWAWGTFRRRLGIVICLCILPIGSSWHAAAQSTVEGGGYLLGTASTGGSYHPVGVALSTLIKLKLLPKFDVDLTAVNTDGSQQNIELIRRNDIQFGIISALAGHEARTGSGQFATAGPDDGLRAITTLWLSTDHLLVRGDSVESGTIEDFLGLTGRPVSLGRPDSGTLLENRTMLSALGVDIDTDFDLVELGYEESAAALAEGRIDGMSVSGGVPIGAVQDAFERLGDGVAALEISDEQLARIDGGRGLWQRVVIPSGTYPGQARDIFTIGTPNILAVRADIDDDVVYQITRTIFEEIDYLHGLHPTTRQISLDGAVNDLPLPIHEGAARYYTEKGLELPPPPVELDPDLLVRYPAVAAARTAVNDGVVTMFAGTEGDTSTRIAAELATVLSPAEDGVRLLATNGGGLGRNLTDLLYLKGVDTALIRADILNYAQDQEVYPGLRNQVTYIAEMFPEEVHLLVAGEIGTLADLEGRSVNLGPPGSGAGITGSIVLSQLGLNAETTAFEPRIAIEKLERGEIQGAFFVGGKPMPLLRQIEQGSGLKLLSLPAIDYFDSYRRAEILDHDYPNLTDAGEPVSTIAARTALLTYAWRPDSARYQALSSFTDALFGHLLTLHEDGFHPKWREVDPTAELASWQRFEPASRWVDDNQGTARRIAGEGRLRQQQDAGHTDAGLATEPRPATPAVSSRDAAIGTRDAAEADAVAVPQTPVIELTPELTPSVEPAGDEVADPNGSTLGEATARPFSPPRDLSEIPAATVKNPTF